MKERDRENNGFKDAFQAFIERTGDSALSFPCHSLPAYSAYLIKEEEYFIATLPDLLSRLEYISLNPRLLLSHETDVLRSDQAAYLTPDDFALTVKDPSLWKKGRDGRRKPEYVIHENNEVSLFLYENRFCGTLLLLLKKNLDHILKKALNSLSLAEESKGYVLKEKKAVQKRVSVMLTLAHRINVLERTYFFQQMKKKPLEEDEIHSTQILLKDPYYSPCYRLYRKLDEHRKSLGDNDLLFTYFGLRLTEDILKEGFTLEKPLHLSDLQGNISFTNGKRKAELSCLPSVHGYVLKRNEGEKEIREVSYLLLLKGTVEEGDYLKQVSFNEDGERTVLYPDERKEQSCFEEEITSEIKEDLLLIPGDGSFYNRVCPFCSSVRLQKEGHERRCRNCGSEYIVFPDHLVVLRTGRN